MITYQIAATSQDFETGKKLFEEYAASLNVDLSFQNFSKELDTISEQYNEPAGALLLARDGETFVGCSGVRRLDEQTAELKRMYVKTEYRGYQVGLNLLERSIELAKKLGYKKIRLDTLENMTKAQQLYRSFGFYEIPSYRFNPLHGTIYMEKDL
ncbi:GNAT family N-acetyltransferase [Mucilaginibacter ginsenosidivorans]|uniref:GNAT family N-acetyltransferase n=1 Tax=Mucilaginibacter ginsenosidivorans TaxID=398053 RepID=A0A5B8UQS1_9SPHI|nr:GNAT family N-acetyltransferase [Mucilaginibacter ginsenosidivorans]QEC61379.1 GNAT family N-acetyltransferase [Mucilaginibacter ginsenosidivorans]